MKNASKILICLALVLVAMSALTAPASAAPPAQDNGPIVIINQPPSNAAYVLADIISIQSVSASPVGIVQVDLLVDGQVVHTDIPPGTLPETQFTLIQRWVANLKGTHLLTVRATDSENRTGQSSIQISIADVTLPAPAATPAVTVLPAPAAAPKIAPTRARFACLLAATFVRSDTIPDYTIVTPGTAFVKTWTLRNTGTCKLGPATFPIFVGGARMSGIPLARRGLVKPGATFTVSVKFVAPLYSGIYQGAWRLKAANGTRFGPTFYVRVALPGAFPAVPAPQPIVVPAAVTWSGCQGVPQISSFYADDTTLARGSSTTLHWGFVGNADAVYLNTPDGSGGVPTPGEQDVQPDETGTYTLAAYCSGYEVTADVTIHVNEPPVTPVPDPGPRGSIDNFDVGKEGSKASYQVRVYYTWNGHGGPAEVCATATNSPSTPCTNARSNAPYAVLHLAGDDIGTVTVCLIDAEGHQLACSSN